VTWAWWALWALCAVSVWSNARLHAVVRRQRDLIVLLLGPAPEASAEDRRAAPEQGEDRWQRG
jgi:hypothetical protein